MVLLMFFEALSFYTMQLEPPKFLGLECSELISRGPGLSRNPLFWNQGGAVGLPYGPPRPPASLPLQPKPKAKACACAMQTGGTDKLSLRPILVFPFPPKIRVFLKVF